MTKYLETDRQTGRQKDREEREKIFLLIVTFISISTKRLFVDIGP